jgi:CBS domain-containing protein
MMNRIPFMKTPTTAQTNNDSLFLGRNVPSVSAKDPTLLAIEEEIGKISLQHRQFKNETIEEIDSRVRRYGSEIGKATSELTGTMKKLQTAVETISINIQEPIDVKQLKQELAALMVHQEKPAEDGSVQLKDIIGKNLNGLRQDITKLREAAPVYPNYDRELADLKSSMETLRAHLISNMASKNDVNALFGIVGNMKAPVDELRRTIAGLDLSSIPRATPVASITSRDVVEALGKNNKEIGDMVGKLLHTRMDKMDSQQKTIKETMDSQQKTVKEMMESQQKTVKEMMEHQQRFVKETTAKPADNLTTLIDNRLNSFYDRIKSEIVVKMAERLDEVLMQTRKLENYFVESRSQFSDSIRGVTKKIDDSLMDKDTKDIIASSIIDFMTKNKSQVVEGISNHIAEDMIVILRELKERFLTNKPDTEVKPEPKQEVKVIHKPNPFAPIKK